jgi:hypothetical protein
MSGKLLAKLTTSNSFDYHYAYGLQPKHLIENDNSYSKITPVLLGERLIPVAPFKNPLCGISYHRIRLHNPADIYRVVELFVRDTNLYFTGFRRGVVVADGGEPQWGTLFIFDGLYEEAPPFLFFHAVKMGIRSDHTKVRTHPNPYSN